MNIYVANVPYSVKDQDLHELFSPFGEVTSAKIIMDKATNRSRGFGFVEMANDDAGRAAIEGTNGKNFHGRDLVVNEARPRTEGDRGGFGGGPWWRSRWIRRQSVAVKAIAVDTAIAVVTVAATVDTAASVLVVTSTEQLPIPFESPPRSPGRAFSFPGAFALDL
jgi:RNA recognition motif-containing protein